MVYFIHLFHSSMALQLFVGPWPLFQFRNLFYTEGRSPWTSDQPVASPLPTHRETQTQNKSTHRYPYLEWDLNPRSQLSSKRRQFLSQTRRFVPGFPRRQPKFEPGCGYVGFVVDKVALGQVFSEYFGFPCQSLFH
jgi:hypothetical protein